MDNLRVAVRSLVSTPGPTLVVIATLAIAIGVNTAVFSVVDGVLLRPLYADDRRLVALWATNGGDGGDIFRLSPADYRDMRDTAEAFDGQVLLYRSIGSTLTGLDRPIQIGSLAVTSRVFDVLGVRPAAGQFFTDEDENPGARRGSIGACLWGLSGARDGNSGVPGTRYSPRIVSTGSICAMRRVGSQEASRVTPSMSAALAA